MEERSLKTSDPIGSNMSVRRLVTFGKTEFEGPLSHIRHLTSAGERAPHSMGLLHLTGGVDARSWMATDAVSEEGIHSMTTAPSCQAQAGHKSLIDGRYYS